jgi:hypothetical protein
MPKLLHLRGPLVWEEIENAQTEHKGLAKLLYRFFFSTQIFNFQTFTFGRSTWYDRCG